MNEGILDPLAVIQQASGGELGDGDTDVSAAGERLFDVARKSNGV